MEKTTYEVVVDAEYGYRRLEPVPTSTELDRFYQSRYFDLIKKGGRAPELQKLMAGGETAQRERDWLRRTLHADVCTVLKEVAPGERLLDVGCGTGDFSDSAREHGFDTTGIEPSTEAAGMARSRGLTVHAATLQEYADTHRESRARGFDAAVLLNVLEHVPHPVRMLAALKTIMAPGAVVCIRVPNDYSEVQLAAHEKLGGAPWWVAVPDHVNYFNFESLRGFLSACGFEVVRELGEFPLEFFLLMGESYVGDPQKGAECHQKRVALETGMPDELRRRFNHALATVGMGRNCLTFARLR
jgi:2-polyprenyl-3-methyl-5-hydroxy-6-metoxy-1,4-benzoquinol methylase